MENDKLIKEALIDWKKGKLSEISALFIIFNLAFPQDVSKEAIEWSKKTLRKVKEKVTVVQEEEQ